MDTTESLRAHTSDRPRARLVPAPERPDAYRQEQATHSSAPPDRREREAIFVAALFLVVAGAFQVLAGVYALTGAASYAQAAFRLQDWSSAIWGWAQLSLGAVLAILGIGVVSGWEWAFIGAFFAAAVSAAMGVVLFPYYPVWAVIIVTFDIVACGLLIKYGFGLHADSPHEESYSEVGIDASWARRYSSTNAAGGAAHLGRAVVEEE